MRPTLDMTRDRLATVIVYTNLEGETYLQNRELREVRKTDYGKISN